MANLYLGRFAGPDGFEKLVAIKIIHDHLTANPEFVRMFVDEARLVSRIYHPNVAQIIELGRVGRTYFIAMEYVEGESVGAILRRTKPSYGCAARIVADAAAGLHAAHELRNNEGEPFNVVHRDVSPQNILVAYGGTTKVVDFGVAHAKGMLHTTKDGSLKGKFGYMAPEQAASQPVDRRADVFVLGVVLYELTTRRKLFKAASDSETIQKVLSGEITRPTEVCDDYPPGLEEVVLRALQRERGERYQTAEAMQEAIEKFIVTHGDPVLPTHVGKMMAEVFADRVKKKKRILATVNDDSLQGIQEVDLGEVPDVDLEGSSVTWFTRFTRTLSRRRAAVIGVGVAVLAGLVIFIYPLLSGKGPTASVEPPRPALARADAGRPPRPARVTITISVKPENATIEFAGNRVGNPFEHRTVPSKGEAQVVVAAPGHDTKRFKVSLAKDSQWMIELSKRATPATAREKPEPAPEPRTPRKRKKRRKQLADDDVLVNPYQQ